MDWRATLKDRRVQWGIGVVIAVVILFGVAGGHGLNEPERVALKFYKTVWVQGQGDVKALADLQDPNGDLDYEANVARLRKWGDAPLILGSEKRDDKSYNIYIHRPDKNIGVSITVVEQVDGEWKVSAFDRNDPSRYNSLRHSNSEMEWQQIERED